MKIHTDDRKHFHDMCRKTLRRSGRAIGDALRIEHVERPVSWAERSVDLRLDLTSDSRGMIKFTKSPYLRYPLTWACKHGQRKLTAQAPEQTGKSTLWKLIFMWLQCFRTTSAGIVYQNKDVGGAVIRDSLVKLMEGIRKFRRHFKREGWSMKRLPVPGGVTYLMTGDSPIISYPMGLMIGDECNDWRQEKAARKAFSKRQSDEEYQVSKIKDMDKRGRNFPNFCRVLVCTPTSWKGPISTETALSTCSRWYVRCLNPDCEGVPTLVDKETEAVEYLEVAGEDPHGLTMDTTCPEDYCAYETNADGDVVPGSVRFTCPACGHVHEEADKHEMTERGDYAHRYPDRLKHHLGVNWGALASVAPGVDWTFIATAIEVARVTGSREAQQFLWNSVKGLPYRPEVVTGDAMDAVRSHGLHDAADPEVIARWVAVYMAVDTQDVGYWATINAVDDKGNWYTLAYRYCYGDEDVVKMWEHDYHGIRPIAGIIDEGGHRKKDVNRLVSRLGAGFWKYKGDNRGTRNVRESENEDEPFLLLAKSRHYQAELLYMIYTRKHEDYKAARRDVADHASNNRWYVLCEVTTDFVKQMASMQPPRGEDDADYEDWYPAERQHDLFDCHKMAIVIHDYALREFADTAFLKVPEERDGDAVVIVKKSGSSQPTGRYY